MKLSRISLCCLMFAFPVSMGCGEAFSSLPAVSSSDTCHYELELRPDFGRRGDLLVLEVDMELPDLPAYPTDIHFGQGVSLRSFDSEGGMQIEVLISPLAEEGERRLSMDFVNEDGVFRACGRFWVLPALP